jgi:hypothetical protein
MCNKVKSTVVSSKTSTTSTSKLKRSRAIEEEVVSVSVKEAKLGKFFFLFFFHVYSFFKRTILQKLLLVYFQSLHQELIFNGVNLILL